MWSLKPDFSNVNAVFFIGCGRQDEVRMIVIESSGAMPRDP